MSYVAKCEQCGVLERGDLEAVGDVAEDHEQFHDVRVKRVTTDGGLDGDCPECGSSAYDRDRSTVQCPDCDLGYECVTDGGGMAFTTAFECRNCGAEWSDSHPSRTRVEWSSGQNAVVVRNRDCDEWIAQCETCCQYVTCPTCELQKHVTVVGREPIADESGEPEVATDGGPGSAVRPAGRQSRSTIHSSSRLQKSVTGRSHVFASVRIAVPIRENKRPVTAYKDLLKAVIKRANGIEEEQKTLGKDEWDPETADLRNGETTDVDSHAQRNAEQLRMGEEDPGDDDVVTDGGQDVRSEWSLVCTDCDWKDELVTEGQPRDGPPSEVEDRVREHKGTVDWSHVVRVEGRVAGKNREIDPALLTDGGQSVDDMDQLIQDYLDDRDELQDATLHAREFAIRDFLDWIEEGGSGCFFRSGEKS